MNWLVEDPLDISTKKIDCILAVHYTMLYIVVIIDCAHVHHVQIIRKKPYLIAIVDTTHKMGLATAFLEDLVTLHS